MDIATNIAMQTCFDFVYTMFMKDNPSLVIQNAREIASQHAYKNLHIIMFAALRKAAFFRMASRTIAKIVGKTK